MANEKIDVKAEAKGITWMSREDAERGIIDLCDRVRKEAIRETVKRCIEIVKQQFAAGRRPEIERVLRAALAEPGKEQEQADSQPDTLRQFVDAAVAMAAHYKCVSAGTYYSGGLPCERPPCGACNACTILRLAPQFMEKP